MNAIRRRLRAFRFTTMFPIAMLSITGCTTSRSATDPPPVPSLDVRGDVAARLRQFVPTPITYDLRKLSATDRAVLDRLVRAARLMDEIYLRQSGPGNAELFERLQSSKNPQEKEALQYFAIAGGPWDPIDDTPFIGKANRPDGAGYYPADLQKSEFDGWLAAHPADKDAFQSLTTVIHRDGANLVAVPYSKEYREWLAPAAKLLREAAAIGDNASLGKFLRSRADAFLSDDYFESDCAWMDMDSRIEVTIGPYETYMDKLFGYKSSFEAYVTVQDPDESARLKSWASKLPEMEQSLPIPDEYKNPNRGTDSPIRVVYVVFTAGDTKGVQSIAYNLPNDEKVREKKGSKKVLLKNVIDAKFEKILSPIADRVVAADQRPNVTSEAFFSETLLHELSHGIGPGFITLPSGEKTEVRLALRDLYSAIEEAKADVMGVYNAELLIDRGIVSPDLERTLYPTYLAGMFRAVRFGQSEAHGLGTCVQFNWIAENGGFVFDPQTKRYRVDPEKAKVGLRSLLTEILMTQALGDYGRAKALFERYGKATPEMQAILSTFTEVPVDLAPEFTAVSSRQS
ncbi:MAG: peptidase [Planctomycetes bacterium]|nr:peptidase [Planctomycetota bacterium]MBI3846530.1 peptidase [Planctomycetota bacterium]